MVKAETALGRRVVSVGYMRRFDPAYVDMRNKGWQSAEAKAILGQDLATVATSGLAKGINPQPVSGRQERLENMWDKCI